jgi:hypothetical protein
MIELPTSCKYLKVYCQLITINDVPFIYFTDISEVGRGINCIYAVSQYSIEKAHKEFLKHIEKTYIDYENR